MVVARLLADGVHETARISAAHAGFRFWSLRLGESAIRTMGGYQPRPNKTDALARPERWVFKNFTL